LKNKGGQGFNVSNVQDNEKPSKTKYAGFEVGVWGGGGAPTGVVQEKSHAKTKNPPRTGQTRTKQQKKNASEAQKKKNNAGGGKRQKPGHRYFPLLRLPNRGSKRLHILVHRKKKTG